MKVNFYLILNKKIKLGNSIDFIDVDEIIDKEKTSDEEISSGEARAN